jgi:uncharacterized OsmC-like protein
MITSKIIYEGDLHTRLVHIRSGSEVMTDAPVDNKGKGEAFSPTDLAATSLASCMLTTMGMAGQTHGFTIDGASAEVTKIMASGPRRIDEIIVELSFPEGHLYSDKVKSIIRNIARTCPVAQSLHPDLKQTVLIHF